MVAAVAERRVVVGVVWRCDVTLEIIEVPNTIYQIEEQNVPKKYLRVNMTGCYALLNSIPLGSVNANIPTGNGNLLGA